ncbi:HNH endonuclease [Arthrobacter sp. HY1533]|uniref:HNH endonuclease n=1 Tax=Arthrobacter sp. HY1533 TaxID=2970919 RepID=UPI0022BA0D84|nr:HNH endonuclease [Arthrobacter sp. HY1533]
MSIPVVVPGDRGGGAAQDVAALLAGITLPSIEPFGTDNVALAGLPEFMVHPAPDPEPASQASVARSVVADGVRALSVIKGLEDKVAACKAALVDRVLGAASVEAVAYNLDRGQRANAESGCVAEIALVLGIAERTAAALGHRAVALQHRPVTREALVSGAISWRHVCTVLAELETLAETPSVTENDVKDFEARLLRLAVGTTAGVFAAKACRARESLFPASLGTRTAEAFRSRRIGVEPGRDGMSWLSLHLPTLAANAIMVHCTRTARAIKANAAEAQRAADARGGSGEDVREYRTLEQLRADVAAILLLGQEPPTTTSYTTTSTGPGAGGSPVTFGPRGAFDHPGPDEAGSRARAGSSFFPTGQHPPRDTSATVTGRGGGNDSAGGDVVFGQRSAFGVTVTDEEPPWQHARPDPPPDASPQPTLPQVPEGAAVDAGTPLEGTILPAGGPSQGTDTAGEAAPDQEGDAGEDVPVAGVVVGDGSGWVDGVVDGILEHPQAEYLQQLADLANNVVLADPPLPKALVLVTVPVLGLLGLTDEPAELDDRNAGPVPMGIARKLLAGSSTFLRVLTDPISGEALPLEPERYTLRDAEKAVLQAMAGGCYFPNCTNPVLVTDLDHVKAFAQGGKTTPGNLRPACAQHHRLKHFKDDKNRHGTPRRIAEPWRTGIRLPGWTPKPCPDGRIGWISPSGNYHPPQNTEHPRPAYPKWLKNHITKALQQDGQNGTPDAPDVPETPDTSGQPGPAGT